MNGQTGFRSAHLTWLCVLTPALVLACSEAPTDTTRAIFRSSIHASASVSGATAVSVKSEHLKGTLPNGVQVDVNVKAEAEGSDPSSLAGDGRHFASTGAH